MKKESAKNGNNPQRWKMVNIIERKRFNALGKKKPKT